MDEDITPTYCMAEDVSESEAVRNSAENEKDSAEDNAKMLFQPIIDDNEEDDESSKQTDPIKYQGWEVHNIGSSTSHDEKEGSISTVTTEAKESENETRNQDTAADEESYSRSDKEEESFTRSEDEGDNSVNDVISEEEESVSKENERELPRDDKAKSVFQMSASMQSSMQESAAPPNSEITYCDTGVASTPPRGEVDVELDICPDNEGFFGFPATKENVGMGSGYKNITPKQLFKRVQNKRVLVVSVFGRSAGLHSGQSKASIIFDEIMQKDVFRFRLMNEWDDDSDLSSDGDEDNDPEGIRTKHAHPPYIEGFHDEANSRIYLHLRGSFDSSTYIRTCAKGQAMNEKDIHSFFSEQKLIEAKLLLFLFHVSHLMVCYHERHCLDFNYVNLFQMLDSVRAKLHLALGDYIKVPFNNYAKNLHGG